MAIIPIITRARLPSPTIPPANTGEPPSSIEPTKNTKNIGTIMPIIPARGQHGIAAAVIAIPASGPTVMKPPAPATANKLNIAIIANGGHESTKHF